MPTPQSPDAAAALIDRVAQAAMAGDPVAAGQQGAAAAAPQQPVTDTSAKVKETNVGAAETAGSPSTESDAMAQDAIIYKVPVGDSTRDFTPQQISSMLERYSALNYQHAQLSPIIKVAEAYLKDNPNKSPQEVAATLLDLARANRPNAQFGAPAEQQQQQQAAAAPVDREALAKWAEDNAVSLPPGYEQMMTNTAQMQQGMAQMMQMMRAMMAQSQGMTQAAAIANRNVQSDRNQQIRQQIGMNLDRVQQALGLPSEAANDFMMFAAERGYNLEDFIDPQLTVKVMTDFKNAVSSPEMERIRQIAQRRQAFTAAGLGGTPTGGPSAPPPAETTLDRLTQQALAKKTGN